MPLQVAQLTVGVSVLGNAPQELEQVQAALTRTATTAEETGARGGGAFIPLSRGARGGIGAMTALQASMMQAGVPLGPLGDAFMGFNNTLFASQGLADGLGKKMFVLGGMVTALGAVTIAASAPREQAEARLRQAVANTGGQYEKYSKQVDEALHKGENFGRTNSEVYDALGQLTTGFGSEKKGLQELNLAFDLAAFKHSSLLDAAKTLVRVNEGYGRSLKELGINMTFSHNAESGLEAAKRGTITALEGEQKATERLSEAVDVASKKHANAATLAAQFKVAESQLGVAQSNLIQINSKLGQAESMSTKTAADRIKKAAEIKLLTGQQTAASMALGKAQGDVNGVLQKAGGESLALKHAMENEAAAHQKVVDALAKQGGAQKKLATEQGQGATALNELNKKVSGQAQAQSQTLAGFFARTKAHIIDLAANIGQSIGKALIVAGPALAGIGGLISSGVFGKIAQLGKSIVGLGVSLFEFATGETAAAIAGAALDVILGPIGLIAAAVAVLGVVAVLMWTHWKEVVNWIKANPIFAGVIAFIFPIIAIIFAVIAVTKFLLSNWKQIWQDIQNWTSTAINKTIGFLEKLPGYLGKLPGIIVHFLENVGKDFLKYGGKFIEWLAKGITNAVNKLPHALGFAIGYALASLVIAGVKFVQMGIKIDEWLARGVVTAAKAIYTFFVELPGRIWGFIQAASNFIVNAGIQIITWLFNAIVNTAPKVWDFFQKLPGRIFNFIVSLASTIINGGIHIIESLVRGIESDAPHIWHFFQNLPGQIAGVITEFGTDILNIGVSIVEGIWSGIQSMAGWILDKVGGFFGGLISGALKRIKGGSPALAFVPIGTSITMGIAKGIDDGQVHTKAAIYRHADMVKSEMARAFGRTHATFGLAGAGGVVLPPGGRMSITNIHVQGSVLAERDLLKFVRDGTLRDAKSNGGRYLGGLA